MPGQKKYKYSDIDTLQNNTKGFLLDANIYDELVKPKYKDFVKNLAFLVVQKHITLFTTDIIIGELKEIPDCDKKNAELALLNYLGIETLKDSAVLSGPYQTEQGKTKELNGNVFSMKLGGKADDRSFAEQYGSKTSIPKKKDAYIYSSAKKHSIVLVTNNTKDFKSVELSIINFCEFKTDIESFMASAI